MQVALPSLPEPLLSRSLRIHDGGCINLETDIGRKMGTINKVSMVVVYRIGHGNDGIEGSGVERS